MKADQATVALNEIAMFLYELKMLNDAYGEETSTIKWRTGFMIGTPFSRNSIYNDWIA